MSFFFSISNNLWLSDSLRNFISLIGQFNYVDISSYIELRDYRSPSIIYGQNYNLSIFRGYLKYKFLTIGDNTISFGRGLSLFLSYDEKAILESFLRGINLNYYYLSIYGGIKRRWIYYTSDTDTTYILGSYFQYKFFGFNGLYYKSNDYGFLGSFYIELPFLFLELAYRNGYDIFTFSNNEGYGLFLSINFWNFKLDYNYYDKLFQKFNIPATVNSYGLLASSGRDEMGFSISYSQKSLLLEVAKSYDKSLNRNLLDFYSASFYSNLILDYKIRFYRLFSLNQNLDDYNANFEFKYKGILGLLEYRNRKSESQPFFSIGFIYKYLTTSFNYRMYLNSDKYDYFFEIKFDNTKGILISFGYGSFSGDIVCSSGICRYEPPFEGLRSTLSLSYSFY